MTFEYARLTAADALSDGTKAYTLDGPEEESALGRGTDIQMLNALGREGWDIAAASAVPSAWGLWWTYLLKRQAA